MSSPVAPSDANGTVPTRPRFVEQEVEEQPRATSGAVDSPPVTPNSLTFSIPVNPFSPPASVSNFGDQTPATPGSHIGAHYPFPDSRPRSGFTSVSTSVADLPRMSSSLYGSRPTTGSTTYSDSPDASTRHLSTRLRETFAAPSARPVTIHSTITPVSKSKRGRPKSTMLVDPPQKPWITTRDPYARISYYITYSMLFVGLALSAMRCVLDYRKVELITGPLCMILNENFSTGNDVFGENGTFFREVDMSGFGNGEFEMTTDSLNNSFVANGRLYILPTLTSDSVPMSEILDGFVYNITGCTYNITQGEAYTNSINTNSNANVTAIGSENFDAAAYYAACSAVSNATANTVINPVQSARLSTRKTASMKYGRVEVVAKIPTGDWMWPAIWMLPVDNAYGPWPVSGEIDIMEARGNGPSYAFQGTNYVRASLNWGPVTWLNEVFRTYGWWPMKRGSFDTGFHTYAMEWTEQFINIYVDSRLHSMYKLTMKEPFFERGDFPSTVQNGSILVPLENPWINGTKAAPFDQSFYLILDVGIGGTNGWFPDSPDKPWLNGSPTAMKDFLLAQDQWYPTWPTNPEDRAFVIDSVSMYELC